MITKSLGNILEHILNRPFMASFIVGTSIVGLNAVAQAYFAGQSYFAYLHHSYRIHWLLWASKVAPPYLIPFLVTTAARHLERKNSELQFMEDALPAIFVTILPIAGLSTLHQRVPTKANPAYMALFEVPTALVPQEPLIPERFWKDPRQRQTYFNSLLKDSIVEGLEVDFLTPTGDTWQGKIYSRCKQGRKNVKIQGMIIRA